MPTRARDIDSGRLSATLRILRNRVQQVIEGAGSEIVHIINQRQRGHWKVIVRQILMDSLEPRRVVAGEGNVVVECTAQYARFNGERV